MQKSYTLTFVLLTLAIVTEKSFCDNTEFITNKSPNCTIKILENEEQESPILLYLQDERVSDFLVIGKNKERTYFYNIPKKECKVANKFVISGDKIRVLQYHHNYLENVTYADVIYTNLKTGKSISGWVELDKLQQISKNINSKYVKKITGGFSYGFGGNMMYSITCVDNQTTNIKMYTNDNTWAIQDSEITDISGIKKDNVEKFADFFCKN